MFIPSGEHGADALSHPHPTDGTQRLWELRSPGQQEAGQVFGFLGQASLYHPVLFLPPSSAYIGVKEISFWPCKSPGSIRASLVKCLEEKCRYFIMVS